MSFIKGWFCTQPCSVIQWKSPSTDVIKDTCARLPLIFIYIKITTYCGIWICANCQGLRLWRELLLHRCRFSSQFSDLPPPKIKKEKKEVASNTQTVSKTTEVILTLFGCIKSYMSYTNIMKSRQLPPRHERLGQHEQWKTSFNPPPLLDSEYLPVSSPSV